MTLATSRRGFLKGAAAVTGASVAGAVFTIGFDGKGALANIDAPEFNPFVKIDSDGIVTVIVKHFEMGQGTTTGLTTLIAEELDADWAAVRTEFAPADARYNNLLFQLQATGGSTAMANSWLQYRQAGAAARTMLVSAAAEAWGVAPEAITVENGVIRSGDHVGGFADFAGAAARMTPPAEPTLKAPSAYRLIGADRLPRKDSLSKTDGSAIFAMDVKVPGMLTAVILRPEHFGATLVSFDASGAEGVQGFVDAAALPTGAGVVVYATSTWAAIQARLAITAEWDLSAAETRSTDTLIGDHVALLDDPTYQTRPGADAAAVAAAVDAADQVIEADFLAPYLAHSPMEPLNCVIEPTENGVRIYDGCQMPGLTQPYVAGVLGLEPSQVEVETVYAGGSFGRRGSTTVDYGVEAAIAFALRGGQTPIKLVWTREDDFLGGYFRPMAAHRVRVGLNADGTIAGWDHRVATQSLFKGTAFEAFVVHEGVDHTSVEGLANTIYPLGNMTVGLSDVASPIPVLWWRSVGNTHTAYAMEVVLDMLAEAAGRDPVEYRLELLAAGDADQHRLAGALTLAAEQAGWGQPLPEGHFHGVAAHKSFGSYVAEVAEVSVTDGRVRIERITCAVDCGIAVNPDVIRAQMEGGIGYGLGAVMRNQITFTEGRVDQTNFHTYEPLRIGDIRAIDVHIVPSAEQPTGVGEPGLPPAAPAVANAIYAATGRRLLTMPWSEEIEFAL